MHRREPGLARQHVGLVDHAGIAPGGVEHGQGLQAVLAVQADGIVQRIVLLHRDQIARHDVGAAYIAEASHAGAQLGFHHDVFQVFLADVQQLAALAQRLVQVGAEKPRRALGAGSRVRCEAAGSAWRRG